MARLRSVVLWTIALVAFAPLVLVPLATAVPPASTLMAWQVVTGGPVDRRWVGLDEVSPAVIASVVASEDSRFCAHEGVDWVELNKVLQSNGERLRGASTITMQTVKNVFLWQSRTVVRKAIEIPLAMFADTVWGKRRTLEIYLNVAEWGPGVFGIEAAALHHFGRSAADVSPAQAALLVTTLPNPGLRDPARPTSTHRRLARTIEARARGATTDCLAPGVSL